MYAVSTNMAPILSVANVVFTSNLLIAVKKAGLLVM